MIAGQEVAARASRATAAVLTPEEAFDGALDLWSLCPERPVLRPSTAERGQPSLLSKRGYEGTVSCGVDP
jgi:hypothetical protein